MAVAERGITHGMRYQARALAALAAESDRPCWIAGTTALREDNEVPIVFAATVVVRQLFRHNASCCTASLHHSGWRSGKAVLARCYELQAALPGPCQCAEDREVLGVDITYTRSDAWHGCSATKLSTPEAFPANSAASAGGDPGVSRGHDTLRRASASGTTMHVQRWIVMPCFAGAGGDPGV